MNINTRPLWPGNFWRRTLENRKQIKIVINLWYVAYALAVLVVWAAVFR